MTAQEVIELLRFIAQRLRDHQDELTALDNQVGDGDHGVSMVQGFDAVLVATEPFADGTPSEVLRTAGQAFLNAVGATVGPLYATAFLRAAGAVDGHASLKVDDAGRAFQGWVEGLRARGKAEVGEKTMMDVWIPAWEAFATHRREGSRAGLEAAVVAGWQGFQRTEDMPARRGRASRLAERSLGVGDPGALSAYVMLAAAADWFKIRPGTTGLV